MTVFETNQIKLVNYYLPLRAMKKGCANMAKNQMFTNKNYEEVVEAAAEQADCVCITWQALDRKMFVAAVVPMVCGIAAMAGADLSEAQAQAWVEARVGSFQGYSKLRELPSGKLLYSCAKRAQVKRLAEEAYKAFVKNVA